MSALSKPRILSMMKKKGLVVSPILGKGQVGASSIDLRIGCIALTVRARGLSHVDPAAYGRRIPQDAKHAYERARQQRHERHEIPFRNRFLLHPGMLVLAPTLEWVKIPDSLQGIVTARSSWARQGLSIATATLINPGYEGIITLELANMGEIPIMLHPGLRIAQIAFYELTEPRVQGGGRKSQFNLAFDPREGDITVADECFLPPLPKPRS